MNSEFYFRKLSSSLLCRELVILGSGSENYLTDWIFIDMVTNFCNYIKKFPGFVFLTKLINYINNRTCLIKNLSPVSTVKFF